MGFVDDLVNKITNAIKDMLADGAESCLEKSLDILSSGLNASNSENGVMDQLLATSPVNFTAGGSESIWNTIQTVCENAVVPIAGIILVIILLTDLIQMVISGNNFRDFDTSIFFKWIFKSICGILLISNVFYIASGIFALGTTVTNNALSTLRMTGLGTTGIHIAVSHYGIGDLFGTLILSFLVMIVMFITIAVIVVVLCSRTIEIFMYLGASPLPMATFMNPEWKQMGHNWLRGMISLAFQGLFIVIALSIFSTLFKNAVSSLNNGEDILLQMAFLLGYALALIFTILRSGQISKSIFGAH